MPENKTIKALECCSFDDVKKCDTCPYYEKETKTYCVNDLIKDTLDLSKYQKAEIERLKKANEKNENIIRLANKTIEKQQAELERLNKVLSYWKDDAFKKCMARGELVKKAKSEAIKEYFERLGTIADYLLENGVIVLPYAERGWKGMKCPYCKGKNLYLKRTSPFVQYGCRDCERKIKTYRESGLTDKQIKNLL